jgi:hypothetical protein
MEPRREEQARDAPLSEWGVRPVAYPFGTPLKLAFVEDAGGRQRGRSLIPFGRVVEFNRLDCTALLGADFSGREPIELFEAVRSPEEPGVRERLEVGPRADCSTGLFP